MAYETKDPPWEDEPDILGVLQGTTTPTSTTPIDADALNDWDARIAAAFAAPSADGNVTAQHGEAAEVEVGDVGPALQPGVVFGLAQDTNLYRQTADFLATSDNFVVALDLFAGNAATGGIYFGALADAYVSRVPLGDLYVIPKPGRSVVLGQTGDKIGFYGSLGAVKPTGVAVTAAGIHAALVTLNLIAA